MNYVEWRAVLAGICWTGVVALGITRALASVEGVTIWAILLGQLATILTGWVLVERIVNEAQEETTEVVARRLADALREDRLSAVR